MSSKVINIALLGFGTVGYGVYEVLKNQEKEMEKKLNAKVKIKKVLVRNIEKALKKVNEKELFTTNWLDILNNSDIDIVVEVMGGIERAKTYILEAMNKGKQVVSANKNLIAVNGKELLEVAGHNKVDFMFEASVAGGIPIIEPLKKSLAANYIKEVMGIVNGTTNFILTKMTNEGMDFKTALQIATDLGYAEADPTADVEGLDAGRKIAILSSIAFNSRVVFSDVYTEGITKITPEDIYYAKEMGCIIKLLGVAKCNQKEIESYVCPMLIPKSHPLASVSDSFNAVFVKGDAVGDTMFYGRGAGDLPTASAVVGDIFEEVRNINANCSGQIGCTCYKELKVKPMDETNHRYFLRFEVENKCGVLAIITTIFAKHKVSVAQINQKEMDDPKKADVVVITDTVKEGNMKEAIDKIMENKEVIRLSSNIRVYNKE